MPIDSIKDLILYQDHHLVIANKPAGMPVQADKTLDTPFLSIIESYCKKKLHLCNRIDRPVSGLVLFSKNSEFSKAVQNQMIAGQFHKTYLAIVPKVLEVEKGILEHNLMKSSTHHKSYVTKNSEGKAVRLEYEIVVHLENYHVLKVTTTTGSFHQIRAQLAGAGIPLKGDVKYGARRSNKDRSIGLLAYQMEFYHPSKNQRISFKCPIPGHDIWPDIYAKLPENEHGT